MATVKKTPVEEITISICAGAREASPVVAQASSATKDSILRRAATALRNRTSELLEANIADGEAARDQGLSPAFLDRLALTKERVHNIATGIEEVAALPDPVGEVIQSWQRPNGLLISQVRVPIGVVAIIYESRPNVTADAASLCLKSGNATILRGGSEAFLTNKLIAGVISQAALDQGLPPAVVQLVPTTDRQAVKVMLQQRQSIDVVIPRGGEGLIKAVTEESSIPVIQHFSGICTTYVDQFADLEMAESICVNAKVQRPGVCNAMENLIVHQAAAEKFIPRIAERLKSAGVDLRGCPQARALSSAITPASEEDWGTEYLGLVLSIKIVESIDEAISFIATHGSSLADCIVTEDEEAAEHFVQAIDSAAVFVNASTRFTDGFEFGFGAEVGISTNRLHSRGPMGLRELTTYKYVVRGSGQIRQ